MLNDVPRPAQAAIRTDLGAIFVSMELSRRTWLITSLSPGAGEKMSKHSAPASDVAGLRHRFAELKRKAAARTGRDFPIIVIQEAGLDGFWIHRVLQSEGIESDHFRVKRPMPRIGGFQSFHTARRTIRGFEAMLWLRKGFNFAGAWTVCEQNQLLSVCFGLPAANKA